MSFSTEDTLVGAGNKFQDTLLSGTTLKTINSTSLLGSGDIVISGGSGSGLSYVPVTVLLASGVVSGVEVNDTWALVGVTL